MIELQTNTPDVEWGKMSVLERRRVINRNYQTVDSTTIKVDEMVLKNGALRVRVGKLWFTQKISAVVTMPQVTGTLDRKTGSVAIPAQALNVRVNMSWQ